MSTDSITTLFNTVEVFESVLLQFTLNDLLQAQRVSHHWQNIITTSPSLQQKLFFRPETPSTISSPHFNPLLEALFPTLFFVCPQASWKTWKSDGWTLGNVSGRAAAFRCDASWRKMFSVQPPAKITSLLEEVDCCLNEIFEDAAVISAEFESLQISGIRMGLLYDLVAHMVDGVKSGVFLIDWKMFRPIPRIHDEPMLEGNLEDVGENSDGEENSNDEVEWIHIREVDDGKEALNEIHVRFSNSECHGRFMPKRSAITIMDFNEELVSWVSQTGLEFLKS